MKLVDTLPEKTKLLLRYSNDPVAFTRDIIGLECKNFHEEWLNAFEKHKFIVLLAPRGHGKTSLTASYIIWRIARNRKIRILIVTINQDKANDMMSFIQAHLSRNQKLIDLFGEFKGYHEWTRSQIRVKQFSSSEFQKDATLRVLGVGSSVISAHYDLIILDDITDEDTSKTEARRKTLENWYDRTLVGTFMPHTKVIDIGTRWHEDDIHNYLSNKDGFVTLRYQALLNQEAFDKGLESARVLWPEHLPWDEKMAEKYNLSPGTLTLKFIREHQGEVAFALQYQNTIISEGLSKFKDEWITKAINKFKKLDGIIPTNLKRYIGVDLGGEDKTSDWGVSTVIGIDPSGDIYILDSIRTHSPINRQIEIMKSLDNKWNASRIGMDAAAQQKYIVSTAAKENPNLPIIAIKPSRVNDKQTRADRLSILFETGRVYLNPKLEHLIDELKTYPRGKHDDCIDSLSFALEASQSINKISWDKAKDYIITKRNKSVFKI